MKQPKQPSQFWTDEKGTAYITAVPEYTYDAKTRAITLTVRHEDNSLTFEHTLAEGVSFSEFLRMEAGAPLTVVFSRPEQK